MSRRRKRWAEPLLLAIPVLAGGGWWAVAAARGGSDPEPVAIEATGPIFGSLDELVAASDVVVIGEVVSVADGRTLTDPADPTAGIRTQLVTIEVSEPIVGDPSAVLVVEEEASLLDGTPIIVNGVEASRPRDRGLYFLVEGTDANAPYLALVNEQGRYLVSGAGLEAAADDALGDALAALGLDGLARAVETAV
jgi:hypothetical protein